VWKPNSALRHLEALRYAILNLHPFWEPLRDPHFEKIVASLAPTIIRAAPPMPAA
jgi:hypothetical protein